MKTKLAILLLSALPAQAHFALLAPASEWRTEDGGKGGPPCGTGLVSNAVTPAQGGHPLPIQLQEFIFHPGHYRIALAVNSKSELPADPAVVEVAGSSVSAAIQNPAKAPVLADGMFAHTAPPTGDFRGQVILPNLNCERCTLQIIEFMAEHGAPFFYHHCAVLKIQADPALPPADADWPRAAGEAPAVAARPTAIALPHLAVGGGWQTSLTLVNLANVAAPYTVKFWGDDGAPLELNLLGLGKLATVSGTLPPGGSQTLETDGSPPETVGGWAEMASPQAIDGVALLRLEGTGQEAAVPLLTTGARRVVLPFDSRAGLGIALTNLSATDDTTVTVTVRNEAGVVLTTLQPISLGRRRHNAFALPAEVSGRGIVELESDAADLYVQGIRTNGGAMTAIRALPK